MAKRFIDTELFDDEWFCELSKDGKLFWIYVITKCDHAGLLKYNKKLIMFHLSINSIDTVIKELGNRLIIVNEHLIFCPKFIDFQYPNFPNSSVRQQASAIQILLKYGLYDEKNKQLANSLITVSKDLTKSYEHDNDNVYRNNIVNIDSISKKDFTEIFYEQEIESNKNNTEWIEAYESFVKFLYGENDLKKKAEHILKIKNQLSLKQFITLFQESQQQNIQLRDLLNAMLNNPKYAKGKESLFLTLKNWIRKNAK